jgi:hypothetical protein
MTSGERSLFTLWGALARVTKKIVAIGLSLLLTPLEFFVLSTSHYLFAFLNLLKKQLEYYKAL